MAFALRRPFAVSNALRQLPKSASIQAQASQTFRNFSSSPFVRQANFNKQSTTSLPSVLKSRPSAFQNAFQAIKKRGYADNVPSVQNPLGQGSTRQRLLYGLGIFGGTILATNLIFNRETREDGGMPLFERKYLNDTFMHTGLGLGIIGIAARALYTNGFAFRLMSASPWMVFGVGLVGSIGTMMGTLYTSPDNYVQKYTFWTGFNLTQAALLCPLMFLQPALLARAGIYTLGMMGSIAFVGATAKQEKYLYLGGPLLAGVAIVALSGLAPMVIPATAARTLMWTENIWLYGGLVVFGGFTLYDVQKILHHARMSERGMMKPDPVNESVSLELDFINIFIRLVQILGMQQRRK